jgi:hypothetical protein
MKAKELPRCDLKAPKLLSANPTESVGLQIRLLRSYLRAI